MSKPKFEIGKPFDVKLSKLPTQEIVDNLKSVMYDCERRSYTKNLTEEEMIDRREEYSDIGIKLSQIAKDKKEAMDHFKLIEKEPKLRASELVEAIKYKSEQIHGELFMVDDQDEKMMYFFDESGMCVDERPLTKEERQLKLKSS